jgi:predicted MFS family arabinose efflux permease
VYNTTQALGLFLGGVIGGVLTKYAGAGAVWAGGAALTLLWLVLGLTMVMPPLRRRQGAA